MWAPFSLRQFTLLHQVTKEIPNLDEATLRSADCPEAIAQRLVELVRRGRNEIGGRVNVLVGFADAVELELRRDITAHDNGHSLEIDSGTTAAAAAAWRRVGQSIANVLGSPELDLRTGGSVAEAAQVFEILGRLVGRSAISEPRAD